MLSTKLVKWLVRPVTIFLLSAHSYYLILLVFQKNQSLAARLMHWPDTLTIVAQLAYSYVTFFVLYYLVDTLAEKYRWRRMLVLTLFLVAYSLALAYRFTSWDALDYQLIRETIHDATQWGVLEILANWLEPEPLIIGLLALVYFWRREVKQCVISRYKTYYHKSVTLGLALTYSVMLLLNWNTYDPLTYFFQSGINYYSDKSYAAYTPAHNTYPYLQDNFVYHAPVNHTEKPPIFLLLLESFNTFGATHTLSNGEKLMPVFNRLKSQGVYVDQFYSHSVLSLKSYGSILSGLLPLVRGKLITQPIALKSLPHILSDNNYISTLIKEQSLSLNSPLNHFGIDNVVQLETLLKSTDTTTRFKSDTGSGWGYEDTTMYTRFFEYLDKANNNQPEFNMVITQYNHTSFSVPVEKRQIVKQPKNLQDKFMNSIRLSDDGLAVFFEELRKRPRYNDAIVIITGDHGYPLGNHGITTTENGIYDESYRVPLLVLWPGKLTPRVIPPSHGVYGHRDIAPTLVDLARLKVQTHNFTGQSIFKPKTRPTLLLQPFTGTYLQAIHYPYHYIYHKRTGQELAFNLNDDPLENYNIFSDLPESTQRSFRDSVNELLENHAIIMADQVFPII